MRHLLACLILCGCQAPAPVLPGPAATSAPAASTGSRVAIEAKHPFSSAVPPMVEPGQAYVVTLPAFGEGFEGSLSIKVSAPGTYSFAADTPFKLDAVNVNDDAPNNPQPTLKGGSGHFTAELRAGWYFLSFGPSPGATLTLAVSKEAP